MNANNFHASANTKTRQHIAVQDATASVEAAQDEPSPVQQAPQQPVVAPSGPGLIILQWLTYAFWGWLIVGLIWLIALIILNALSSDSSSVTGMLPYAIAGTVVILPIAFICDLVYRSKEPKKKTGASTVIMVIHAVLYALLGIAALITAVFTLVNLSINIESDTTPQIVTASTAGAAALLYALTFLRVVQPLKKSISLPYNLTMGSITLLLLAFAIIGPVMSSFATRNDRLIENNIDTVQSSVNRYIRQNNKIPASIDEVTITNAVAKKLIADKKIDYVPGDMKHEFRTDNGNARLITYRYQLCANYDHAKNSKNNASLYYENDLDADGYSSYIQTYSHDAGRVCYKLSVEDSSRIDRTRE